MAELQPYAACPLCPGCGCKHEFYDVARLFPSNPARYCSGSWVCKRRYPHLHFKCGECGCRYVTETRTGYLAMAAIES